MSEVTADMTMNEQLRSTLARLGALDNTAEMAAAKRQIGTLALMDQRRRFTEASSPQSEEWDPLSDATIILRKGGPKIYDDADIAAKRAQVKILRDTNRLYASLTPSAPGNILEVLPGAVRIGTNTSYAEIHHRGASVTFRFTDELKKRFAKNVSMVKKGMRKPVARKTGALAHRDGQKRKWVEFGKPSPWNAFYFRWWWSFMNADGKDFWIPARPIVVQPLAEWVGKYLRVVAAAIQRITGPK